ncbi:uncharacterized protein LOC144124385 [Amblyomma americanum]
MALARMEFRTINQRSPTLQQTIQAQIAEALPLLPQGSIHCSVYCKRILQAFKKEPLNKRAEKDHVSQPAQTSASACKPGRPSSVPSKNDSHPCETALVKILWELELIKVEQARQAAVLSKIAAKVISEAQSADAVAPDDMPVYPVKTQEELDILEASTKDAATFASLVKTLGHRLCRAQFAFQRTINSTPQCMMLLSY